MDLKIVAAVAVEDVLALLEAGPSFVTGRGVILRPQTLLRAGSGWQETRTVNELYELDSSIFFGN